MSWAVTTYHCKECQRTAGDLHTWGLREYIMPSGVRIPMNWTLGWCHDCDDVTAIELLDAARCEAELAFAEADLSNLGPRPGNDAAERALANWNHLAGIVEDAKAALHIVRSRNKPLHCLACVSERVTPWQLKADEPMNPIHGTCGGALAGSQDGFRIALELTLLRYDMDGALVDQEDVPGYSVPDPEHFAEREAWNSRIRGLDCPVAPTVDGSVRPWLRFS